MRIIGYRLDGRTGSGVLDGNSVRGPQREPSMASPGEVVASLDDVELLAPCRPRVVVCAAANYAGQLAEKGMPIPAEPGFFLKAVNAVAGPNASVYRPEGLRRLEYEGELAVVIGRTARDVRAESFADYVLGYTCANDITADDYRADGQWYRAKSADTFCPLGPWIETDICDPASLRVRTLVNGEVRQDSPTSDMVFGVPELLAWITRWFTLQAGDVLLTGSPANVGPLTVGDTVDVDIDAIGRLTNRVSAARP